MTTTRKKKLEKTAKDKPYLDYDAIAEIANDADKMHDLKAVFDMEGGKILVDALLRDVVGNVNKLSAMYGELSHSQLISLAAAISVNIELVRTLTRSTENLKNADEALKDALSK